ncbi:MAG TPA: DUF6782 family putative metallopeptidase [Actinomycetota bacterium]|nr:DUF6782 family putative metallopeptidase [Actinomycetota bacterium]
MTDSQPNPEFTSPPPSPPELPPDSTVRKVGLVWLAIVIAATLAFGVFVLVTTIHKPDEADPRAEGGEPKPAEKQALLREVESLKKFVEEKRGLTFKSDVTVTVLSETKFKEELLAEERDELAEQEADDSEDVLRALGLIDKDVNLAEEADELVGEGVLGFYDSETDELVIRGEESTPFLRGVLVHELTHALQDQHFNLERPEYDERSDEIWHGFQSLIEGDAVRIEELYFEQLPSEQRRQYQLEEEKAGSGVAIGDFPEVLLQLLVFPYQVGPQLVDAILDSGGQAALDQAFLDPPTTTEQILHPERYLKRQAPKTVPPPAAGGEVFDEGVFGEFALILLLAEGGDPQEAVESADGWGGDYYVAWREAERTCVRVDFVMDRPADRKELIDAIRKWGPRHPDAKIETSSAVRVTACA